MLLLLFNSPYSLQALSRIASANRTCSIFIGIGDKYNDEFKVVEYSHQTVNIYNDRYAQGTGPFVYVCMCVCV